MKRTTHLISYFFLLILFSCQPENNAPVKYNKYYLKGDSCRTIQFVDDEKILINRDCKKHSPNKTISLQKLNGEIVERYMYDTLTYQVDSIDSNKGKYISAYDKKQTKCYGLHIIDMNSYLIVTPLKQGQGIEDHFTEPSIYHKTNTDADFAFDKKLIIQFSQAPKEGVFHIAYHQNSDSNYQKNDRGNTIIALNGPSNHYKTNLEVNPTFYAFKKYQINVFDTLTNKFVAVPILYHKEYSSYLEMTEVEQQQFCRDKKIEHRFIVVQRFNPGRVRTVHKLYKEKIDGQVQPFELVNIP